MNIENLIKLYEVGQKILRERLPIGFGSFDINHPECGSFACLSGWYGRECGIEPSDANYLSSEIFGISNSAARRLFSSCGNRGDEQAGNLPGPAAYAELERRMEYLAGLIREAGGTVPGEKPKYTGLPQCVRDILEMEVA